MRQNCESSNPEFSFLLVTQTFLRIPPPLICQAQLCRRCRHCCSARCARRTGKSWSTFLNGRQSGGRRPGRAETVPNRKKKIEKNLILNGFFEVKLCYKSYLVILCNYRRPTLSAAGFVSCGFGYPRTQTYLRKFVIRRFFTPLSAD